MRISYTCKGTYNHYLKIFAASSNYNYSMMYSLRHGKANFQTALEQMVVYLYSQSVWLPCRLRAEYDCLQCHTASTKQERNLTHISHKDFFRSPKDNMTAPRHCRRSALQYMLHALSSQNIQPSSFHTAIHFLPMHLGFFPARECQGREGGMAHTWILFRPATSTQLDLEGIPGLYNFKGIWNP